MINFASVVRRHDRRSVLVVCLIGAVAVALSMTTLTAQSQPPRGTEREPGASRNEPPQPVPQDPETAAVAVSRWALPPARVVIFTDEREAAALTFVQKNRPELIEVLAALKTRNPAEYERAICDFFRTSEMLTALRKDDPGSYELALKRWQAETRVHLLAAQLVRQPTEPERLKRELEQGVEKLIEFEIDEVAHGVQRIERELARAQGQLKELQSRRSELVRERLAALLQAIEQQASSSATERESKL